MRSRSSRPRTCARRSATLARKWQRATNRRMTVNVFQTVAKLKPARIWDGVLARVVNGDRVTIGFVDIDPNAQVPEHRHENEQVGFVLRGSVTMVGDGQSRELGGWWTCSRRFARTGRPPPRSSPFPEGGPRLPTELKQAAILPAIDGQRGSGDEAGGVAGQKDDGGGQLLGASMPA